MRSESIGCGFEVMVHNLEACLLKVRIRAVLKLSYYLFRLQLFRRLHAYIEDFTGRPSVCQLNGWGAGELDVLGRYSFAILISTSFEDVVVDYPIL